MIYAETGIAEYWVVNLNAKELNVFRGLDNGSYVATAHPQNAAPVLEQLQPGYLG